MLIRPDYPVALCKWGYTIFEQARDKTGEEADVLFAKAYEKFEATFRLRPDMFEALYNWADTLYVQAKSKAGQAADALFNLAYEKYEAVLRIEPGYFAAVHNWGNALSDQATRKRGTEAESLFIRCESIEPDRGSYNLACLSALQGNQSKCSEWLQASLTNNTLPAHQHVEIDSDLDSVRDSSWFKEFLFKIRVQCP
jgi:tetratricopeptide (TPR) repeat protein